MIDYETGSLIEDDDEDLDELDFVTFHDLLCMRGNEVGYYQALHEFDEKGYLTEERLYKLKDTLFADTLYKELEKKNVFKKIDVSKIFEQEVSDE